MANGNTCKKKCECYFGEVTVPFLKTLLYRTFEEEIKILKNCNTIADNVSDVMYD